MTAAEVWALRAELAAASELARVRGWHISEVRKLHSFTRRPAIAECVCGLIICPTLRAISGAERVAPAGDVEMWDGRPLRDEAPSEGSPDGT